MDTVISYASYILAISIASERLVEIVKGMFPGLNQSKTDPQEESRRRSVLQVLAVVAGILSAHFSLDIAPPGIKTSLDGMTVIIIGLLASGGSGLWNAVLSYVLQIKDLKKEEVNKQKIKTSD
ncbi:hypothetical protein [Aeromonas sp. R7-1]|uniref:hypothetical protein n=1 Tax=Aeromonas sp. R7-1 TaxID=3138473 RepID=UPI0034A4577C